MAGKPGDMIIRYDPDFLKKLKKTNVRIKKIFKEKILVFGVNPFEPRLNNHPLRNEWKGYRSIDITNDWRAVYAEKSEGVEEVVYFVTIGTHEKLYKS